MTPGVVTLFGGSGFIGRYVVQRLALRGWIIRVAVRHPRSAHFLKPLGDVGQITPIPVAVQHDETVRAAVAGADAVVNLVGILYEKGTQTFEAVHHRGAARIAAAAAAAGIDRLVHMSALGADPRSPSAYARSKAAGEAAVRAAVASAVVVRPSVVFGPEDDFFNRFAAMARLAPALPLIGGGRTRFQPVYVGDVADALVACLEQPRCAGETFELGGPEILTFRELMEYLLAQIHRRRVLVPLSFGVAKLIAGPLEWVPVPPLTRDQVELLRRDNVVSAGARTLQDLGVRPHSIELIVPTYIDRYRPGGRFTARAPA
jgi:NADH dehydrogenase